MAYKVLRKISRKLNEMFRDGLEDVLTDCFRDYIFRLAEPGEFDYNINSFLKRHEYLPDTDDAGGWEEVYYDFEQTLTQAVTVDGVLTELKYSYPDVYEELDDNEMLMDIASEKIEQMIYEPRESLGDETFCTMAENMLSVPA